MSVAIESSVGGNHTGMKNKSLIFETVIVGEELGPVEHPLSKETVQEFANAVDDRCRWYTCESPFGPAIAPPTFVCGDYVRLIESTYDSAGPGWLHAKQESQFRNPAAVGTIIRVEGRIVDKYIRRGRKYIVLDYICASKEGLEVSRHRSTLVALE